MRAWGRLVIASGRMVYRSRDTLLVGLVQPLILIGLIALWKQLRFHTGAGAVDFFSFVATGFAAYGVVGVAQHSMVGAAADYRVQGVLKRVAVTPISPAAFVSAQVVARVGLSVLQVAATLAAAAALGAGIRPSPNLVSVLPLAALTALMGMSLAFVIAGVALDGASITDFGRQLGVASAWLLALLLVASRTYRFTEE